MVYVNTSLEVAQQRNEERPRRLPADVVEKYWKNVQKNMAYFQGLFGNANFMLVKTQFSENFAFHFVSTSLELGPRFPNT